MDASVLKKTVSRAANISEDLSNKQLDKGRNVTWTANLLQGSEQACQENGIPDMQTPIYLLLFCSWNDILEWAVK